MKHQEALSSRNTQTPQTSTLRVAIRGSTYDTWLSSLVPSAKSPGGSIRLPGSYPIQTQSEHTAWRSSAGGNLVISPTLTTLTAILAIFRFLTATSNL